MSAFWWAGITACIWGVVPILEKTGLVKVEPLVGLFYRCLGVLVGLLVLLLFFVKPVQIRAVNLHSAMILVFAGFLASFVGQFAFYHALKTGKVTQMVPISGIYPLVSFALGILVLKEGITVGRLIGVLLISSGIWLVRL